VDAPGDAVRHRGPGHQTAGVSPYNGGLFSDAENPYLRQRRLRDDYLALAI
jgi:hypothetical protein